MLLKPVLLTAIAAILSAGALAARPLDLEQLRPASALPAHIVNQLTDPAACVKTKGGDYILLDRREHTIYTVSGTGANLRKLVIIGPENGHVLRPSAIALAGDDILAVQDSPNAGDRIQYFSTDGQYLGGFPIQLAPRVTVLNGQTEGAMSFAFTGTTFLLNQPAWGSLFAEFNLLGRLVRSVGTQRPTPEANGDKFVHQALNVGIPVVDPTGGFFFVFQTGVPMFRKYDRNGRLLFERHIEGPEMDARIAALPTTWPARPAGTLPFMPPLIRTAAADAAGRLWVSLSVPFTYVYDAGGDKIRTVQFVGGGAISATSLFFTRAGRVLVAPGGFEYDLSP